MLGEMGIAGWLGFWLIIAIGVYFCAGLVAEAETGKVRKWWATIAALWLIWPVAVPAALLYAVGYAIVNMTRYAWKMRGE